MITSPEDTITKLIFNISKVDQDKEFHGHGFETLKGRIKLILDTNDSMDRTILQILKDKEFIPMTTEIRPKELIEAVSNTVGGPHGTGQFSADAVIKIVKDLLLKPEPSKPKTRDVIFVNGSKHGEEFNTVEGDGITLNVHNLSQPLHKHPEEADIRYAYPSFVDQYFILGDFAYYIGQRIMTGGPLRMPHLDAENIT